MNQVREFPNRGTGRSWDSLSASSSPPSGSSWRSRFITNPGSVDVNTVGWILFIVGLIGFVIDLLLWSSWGPGYLRRRSTYVDDGVAYTRRPYYAPRRRRVVDEIDEPAGPPPGY